MSLLKIEKDRLTIDGKEFYMTCGDIQYFRIHPSQWEERLVMMRDFGINTVQTYCPWNLHEPHEGEFDFSGLCDLSEFLSICERLELKVMLRPTPYICGEWDFGGLPYWLLRNKGIAIRCSDPVYLQKVESYLQRLSREFLPHLSTNGGCVIAVDIENEYGGFGNDVEYLKFIRDTFKKCGVDVPFYATDGAKKALVTTSLLGEWVGVNYRIESDTAIPMLRKLQPEKPAFVGEYWCGRAQYWGCTGSRREIAPIAKAYRTALDLGAYVCFYMFAGGTNFGFMNGTRVIAPFNLKAHNETDVKQSEKKFRAITTSYDTEALISEDGIATEKYYACRKELDEYLGKPVRDSRLPEPVFQSIPDVKLTEFAPLCGSSAMKKSIDSARPLTFEELDSPYGFVLYETVLPAGIYEEYPLEISGLCDRADVYLDGVYKGTFMRDMPSPVIRFATGDKDVHLALLVENMGRINTRPQFGGEKGILDEVTHGRTRLFSWKCTPIPLDDVCGINYVSTKTLGTPSFMKAKFTAKGGISTHLHTAGLKKGVAFVNGFNLGRYWCIGPQETLFVPGALLNDGENELVLFELYPDESMDMVSFTDRSILDGESRDAII